MHTIYDETQQMPKFATMYPTVAKQQGEKHLEDYDLYVVGLDMKVIFLQDKVELMAETQ